MFICIGRVTADMNKNFRDKLLKALLIMTIICAIITVVDKRSITAAKIGGYNALKLMEHARVSGFTQEFDIYQTEHFIIKYKKGDENIIVQLGQMLERAYSKAGQAYNYYPQKKVNVLVYPTKEEFWDYQPSIAGQQVMGLFSTGIIHILSPNAYNSDDPNFLQKFEKDGPILHEYVHMVIDNLTGGNVDLWLTEGLALYEEYAQLGTEWAPGFEYKRYYSMDELKHSFMKLDEVQAYRQSFDIVRNMIDQHGRDKMLELLEQMRNLNSFETAYEKVYGEKIDKKMKTGFPVFQ